MSQRQYSRADPNDNSRSGIPGPSGIPLPSSAMKHHSNHLQHSSSGAGPSSSYRNSLAPPAPSTGASRGPRKSNFGVPQAVTRGGPNGQSRAQSSSQQQMLGMSQAGQQWDNGAYARTPMKQSTMNANFGGGASVNRRSTLGGGGGGMGASSAGNAGLGASSAVRPGRNGQSIAGGGAGAGGGGGSLRDTRPLRDRTWQANAQREIFEYLNEVKTEVELTFLNLTVLRSPTSKQFEEIWKFLVLELDPDWVSEHPKVQDEFVPVMKDLQYPFAETITKSSLSAINSPHSWAAITAALHWMVKQAKIKADWLFDNTNDVYVMDVNELDPMSDAPGVRHVLEFDFLAKSYTKFFLEGEDADFTEEEEQLRERYREKFEHQDSLAAELETKLAAAVQEIDSIRSQPTPLELAKAQLAEQETKARAYVANKENTLSALQKNRKICEKYRTEVEKKNVELRELLSEQKRLRRIIQEQNLSEDDIRRITSDEEQLRKTVSLLTDKLNESRKALGDLEVQVARKGEEAEELLMAYDTLITECGLRPPVEPIADVRLDITLDPAQGDPQAMVSGADIRSVIRPALLMFRSAKAAEGVDVGAMNDDLASALEKLQSETEDILDRIREHEDQRVQIEQSIENAKMMMNQEVERARAANAELERNARAIEDDLNSGRGALDAELTNMRIEFETTRARIAKYKEELREAIIAKCTDLVKVVNTASAMLQDLELAADASEARTSTMLPVNGIVGANKAGVEVEA